jgi:uncharacterized CHY-type Zn-finger protein
MNPVVHGINLDRETRCAHYHGPSDIIAIQMKCCGQFYACKGCHIALADHPIELWPETEWHHEAILCGACRSTLSISAYLSSGYRCPHCHAAFNPACRSHYHFYFAASSNR